MKKTYNAPVARIFNIKPAQMMALSTNSTTTLSSENIGDYTIDTKEENASDGSLWGNEW